MGWWYLICLIIGVVLYVKYTFFNKEYDWKRAVELQLPIIGLLLIAFALFMFSPVSTRLIDLLL
jgi:type II secretory pathway component PulF